MTDTSREAFEARIRTAFGDVAKLNDGEYANRHVENDWKVWQASRKALEAEQAQAVEPVAWIERDMQCDDFDPDSVTCSTPVGTAEGWEWVPLYLQSAPPPSADHIPDAGKMVGERAELIARLIRKADAWDYLQPGATRLNACRQAADMLKADAREIEATERQVEILSDGLSKCRKAQQVAVPVPLTINQIDAIENKAYMKTTHKGRPMFEYVNAIIRAAEAHHGITAKHLTLDTDWSAA